MPGELLPGGTSDLDAWLHNHVTMPAEWMTTNHAPRTTPAKGTVMEGTYAYDRPDEPVEGDRESGVRESTELLHRRVESAQKAVAVLKERLGPIRVNVPRPLPGDESMKESSPPPRSDHAAELSKLACEVATLTATLDDVLQTLDI